MATATAVGLIVDGARLPVYLATDGHEILTIWPMVLAAIVGVIVGTAFGARVLAGIPERTFRPVVAVILALLGGAMLFQGLRSQGSALNSRQQQSTAF